MKKGMALEGYIVEDKTVRPMKHYDDTELREKIQTNTDEIDNLDSRVTELEEHGGVEDPTKADKVEDATAGNLASLDENGNLQDSGNDPADFAQAAHAHSSIVDTYSHTDNGISVDNGGINISVDNGESGGEVDITADNIGNLNRALATPSSTPENDATKLITSKAVYDALVGKMNKILTLRIDVNTSNNGYPMTTVADSLLSTFVNNVSAGTYVPVLVELHTQSATLGTILGIAKWTLEGQEDEHDVEIRTGRLLFSTYRQGDGQQQWGDFTDWTKSSSTDIEDYFL